MMTRRWLLAALGVPLLLAAAMAGSVRVASATSAFESGYGFDRTWNAAVRFIRVDRGYKLVEKDETTGYLLFEYTSGQGGSKATLGSIEIVRANEDVRVMVALKEMPSHHEQALISAFSAKLRAEYGEPIRRRKERDKPPAEDAGTDGA